MIEFHPSRRNLLKTGGAVGTVAILSGPPAILPHAEGASRAAAPIATLWPERQRLKVEAGRLKEIHDAAQAIFDARKPPLPKEARAHPALFGYGVEWQQARLPDGSCVVWGDGPEWREVASEATGVSAAAFRAGCLRRAEVMDAYNQRLWDLWEACGVEEAWEAWNRGETALAEIEEGILALPVTDLGLAARQVQILRDRGCAEDDRPLMAFFERIERAAGPAGAPAFATREAT